MTEPDVPKELQTLSLEIPPLPQAASSEHDDSGQSDSESSESPFWFIFDDDKKITEIGIRDGWENSVSTDEFGETLLAAYNSALLDTVAIGASSTEFPKPSAMPPAKPVGVQPESGFDVREWLASSEARLQRVQEMLRKQRDGEFTPPPPERRTFRSSRGYLVLTTSNDTVVDIEANSNAIKNSPQSWLHEDTWEVFQSAGLTTEASAPPTVHTGSSPSHADFTDDDDDVWEGIPWE